MSKSEHLFEGLTHHSVKAFGKILDTPEKSPAPTTAIIALCLGLASLFTFLGDTAVKVIFRKTPVIKSFDLLLSFLCFAAFLVFGTQMLVLSKNYTPLSSISSVIVTGCLYIFLSIYLLLKALVSHNKKYTSENESVLVVLSRQGWHDKKIKSRGEPFFLLLVGFFYFFYNPFGAIPIFFCAISVWLHVLRDFLLGKNSVHEKADQLNMHVVQKDTFYGVD